MRGSPEGGAHHTRAGIERQCSQTGGSTTEPKVTDRAHGPQMREIPTDVEARHRGALLHPRQWRTERARRAAHGDRAVPGQDVIELHAHRDVAMHVAASRPMCLDESQIPASTLENERSIFAAQAAESGKPAEIVEKMVTGRMRKFVGEVTLLGQPFVKDPDQSVEKFLKGAGATVSSYERLEVGEGIEKKSENFAEEVMSQVKASG